MTSAPNRWFPLLLISLILSGCSLSTLNIPVTGEAKLFAEGLDKYILSGDPTTLEQLPQLYPQGNWRPRAENILDMIDQQEQQKALLKQKNKDLARCQENKDLTSCQAEKNALIQDNKMLEATLNQLKEVLIDTELKAK